MKTKMLLTLAIMTLTALNVSAVSIGAGPSTIDYGSLVKGGYAEETITVSTSGGEDLSCTIEYTGDIKDWLSIDRGTTFTLPANSRADLKAIIQPPEDALNGKYAGAIYIKAAPTTEVTSGAGLIVGAGIKIKITAEITDQEVKSNKLKKTTISNTELGMPLKFTIILQNTGNIKTKPDVLIEVYDDSTRTIKKTYVATPQAEILPTQDGEITAEIPSNGLETGRYTAKVSSGQEEQTVSFAILERGTLSLRGILNKITLNKIWVETGETVKITGEMENAGETEINGARLNIEAYLIDETYQTEKLVKAYPSDETLNIPVGEKTELTAYFTPNAPGRYNLQGTVIYSGKKTTPKATILNVIGAKTNYLPYIITLVVIVIGLAYWLSKRGEDDRTRRFKTIWGDYLGLK